MHGNLFLIACFRPGQDFSLKNVLVADPAIETLSGQDRELDFGHVEPTGFLGGEDHFKLLAQGKGFVGGQERVKGPWIVRIEIVLHDDNLFGLSIAGVLSDPLHKSSIILFGAPLAHFDDPKTGMRFKGDKDRANAIALVLIIFPFWFAGLHRQGHQDILDQLTGALIYTDLRAFGVVWATVHRQNLFHFP